MNESRTLIFHHVMKWRMKELNSIEILQFWDINSNGGKIGPLLLFVHKRMTCELCPVWIFMVMEKYFKWFHIAILCKLNSMHFLNLAHVLFLTSLSDTCIKRGRVNTVGKYHSFISTLPIPSLVTTSWVSIFSLWTDWWLTALICFIEAASVVSSFDLVFMIYGSQQYMWGMCLFGPLLYVFYIFLSVKCTTDQKKCITYRPLW